MPQLATHRVLPAARRRRGLVWLATLILALVVLPTGSARAGTIDGTPLNITADAIGGFQARYDGTVLGEFDPAKAEIALAGLILTTYAPGGNAAQPFGYRPFGNPFVAVTPPALTGVGSASDPFELTTVYDGSGPYGAIRVTQVLEYVNGDTGFTARFTLRNLSTTNPANLVATVSSDLSSGGSDIGSGEAFDGPPAVVVGFNDATGAGAALVNLAESPWSAFAEWNFDPSAFYRDFRNTAFGAGMDDLVATTPGDHVIGAQFDKYRFFGLPADGSDTFAVRWEFEHWDALTLDPATATRMAGGMADIAVTAVHAGLPLAGAALLYRIAGANPRSGSTVIGSTGEALLRWTGANPGRDDVTAFLDDNGDGAQQDDEATATASVTWTAAPSPTPTPSATPTPTPTPPATVIPPTVTARRFLASVEKALASRTATAALLRSGVRVTLTAPAAGRATVKLLVKSREIGHATWKFRAPGTAAVRLKLTARGRAAVRAARRLRVTIRLTFTPATGTGATVSKVIALRRR